MVLFHGVVTITFFRIGFDITWLFLYGDVKILSCTIPLHQLYVTCA
jgi:hypothetical protein